MKKRAGFAALAVLLLFGCSLFAPWKTFYEIEYKGKRLVFQEQVNKGFSDVPSYRWRFKLDKLPYIYIDAITTDRGTPYSTDIFEEKSFAYVMGKDTAYTGILNTDTATHTFLYFDPEKISEQDYEAYFHFMTDEWSRVDSMLTQNNQHRGMPHIVGIAYGKKEQFTMRFKGKLKLWGNGDEKNFTLSVLPDGHVSLDEDNDYSATEYSGLSDVKTPGKKLYYKSSDYPLEKLKQMKNQYGSTIDKYFIIIPEKDTSAP